MDNILNICLSNLIIFSYRMDIKTAIHNYCNYQERCHAEVKNKLYELGCNTTEVNEYIATMIEMDVLNEERYAKAFARGKFRMLHWGKVKLVQQLHLHNISEYCIKKGLAEIDDEEYEKTLRMLTERKMEELSKEKKEYVLRGKLYRYLVQKGYESNLAQQMINSLLNNRFG